MSICLREQLRVGTFNSLMHVGQILIEYNIRNDSFI